MNPNQKNPRQNVTKPEGQETKEAGQNDGQVNKPRQEGQGNRNQQRGGQPPKQNNRPNRNQNQNEGGQPPLQNEQGNRPQGQGNRNQNKGNKSGNPNNNNPKEQGQPNRQQGNNQGSRQNNNQGNNKQQGNKQQGSGQQKQQNNQTVKAAPLINARTIVELASKTTRIDVVLPPMIKVCGNRDPENIHAVVAAEPDFLGFIFSPESPRFVGDDFEMPNDLPEFIKTVGVFVNAPVEEMIEKFDRYYLAYVQLHGDEPVAVCEELSKAGIPVIKVFSVGPDFDFRTTKAFENSVDYFLFDTKGDKPGGNGVTFDWSLLKRYAGKVPFFLSGGLSPDNIGRAMDLKLKGLAGFDINSGVETSPGVKDAALVLKVKDQVRLKHNPA